MHDAKSYMKKTRVYHLKARVAAVSDPQFRDWSAIEFLPGFPLKGDGPRRPPEPSSVSSDFSRRRNVQSGAKAHFWFCWSQGVQDQSRCTAGIRAEKVAH